MAKSTPLPQVESDEEHFKRFQLAMFNSAKTTIEKNAKGLPVEVLKAYMKKIGGDLVVVNKDYDDDDFVSPFRIRVTALAGRVNVVAGWG